MAKTIDIKTKTAPSPVENNLKILTVVVLDEKSQPTKDAKVSITPSNASGVTNNLGEIQFTLSGSNTKYDVTATAGGKTVTVPYYATQGGATRLVVNPVYVKNVEAKLHPSFFVVHPVLSAGLGIGIVVIVIVIWKLVGGGGRK
jgi:hypothetical protein